MLIDSYNRVHDYLRISLTDHCNLRCFYCMPEESYLFNKQDQLLTADELFNLSTVFVRLGVNKIRLTGGEPLVRKDFPLILEKIASLGVQLNLTTNGILIHEYFDLLTQYQCTSINLSLDTLKEEKYFLMTKRNHFKVVYENLRSLVSRGFSVKVNAVLMKGINDDEILEFIALTKKMPVEVRFIEFMPFQGNRWSSEKVVPMSDILNTIATQYAFDTLAHIPNETAKRFRLKNHEGSFAIISTMTAPFCGDCNRLRLTADGKMKNCLFSGTETDLRTALRSGVSVEPLIRESILNKAKALGGQFDTNLAALAPEKIKNRSMISIGG